ncbi:glycosyltransferase family 39 protein [Streptosporangium sp. NBC_01639]|uniref:ArnT family glycosyltransferase n=1 Tax=Streptosporangium sp. NBC_01639 TaxID=2975948 RepID=UPI0038684639|nr:glycosyltransferase family 39 protein [Streptosporangium sp. NBC_01639]
MDVRREPRWSRWALVAACALGGVLYGWALGSMGYGNSYYAAAARSMSQSWSNFFFGAFDPLGVSTVDKPPGALWVQALSVRVFGYHGWALIVPQVAEGVLAVAVLHRAVLRWAGPAAASISAVVLALTPVTVAVNRDDNPDTLLVLLLVCAAYAATRAVRGDRPRWLLAAGALVGLAFTAKMLQAWLVAPALFAAWLVVRPSWRRLWQAAAAGGVMVAVSLAWVVAVDLWPGAKPYIGGSRDGGAWDLVIGYNGLGRVLGTRDGAGTGLGNAGPSMGGDPGWDRLFNDQVAGQIGWLLPFCVTALVAAVVMAVTRGRPDAPDGDGTPDGTAPAGPVRAGWVLWGGWLALCWAVFSFAEGIFHPYYTTQLGPAVAALTGAGAVTMWRLYLRPVGAAWALLPVAVGVTALWALVLVRRTPDWLPWLTPLIATAGALGAAGLPAGRFLLGASRPRALRIAAVSVAAAAVALLAAPAAWSAAEPLNGPDGTDGVNPSAGPQTGFGGGMGPGRGVPGRGGGRPGGWRTDGTGGGPAAWGGLPGGGGGLSTWGVADGTLTASQRSVLDHVTAHRDGARILLATLSATGAAPYIIATGEDVIAMGGYNATDQAVSLERLQRLVGAGDLRFVQLSGFTGQGAEDDPRLTWVRRDCTQVPLDGVSDLYRCGT